MKPGTINTIIIVNVPLSQGAQVEAYSIVIEAKKCSACVHHGVTCSKDSSKFAMGTGTDCSVLISQRYISSSNITTAITIRRK
jgi:adenosylcobinamide amidohydrolase